MRRMIPSLQSLICFEAAAKHKTYTHAAQELSMTQSAVSRQIQQLEAFLNLPLFHRVRHGVELTVAGEQYLKNIKTHLLGLEHSTLDLMSHQGLGGTLKLGVVPTFATRWLLPRLHRFNEKYPEITIHLETSTKPFLFSEQIFDAAIYAGTPAQVENWPGTTAHFLMQEDVVAVCSPTLIRKFFPDLIQNQSPSTLDLSPEQLSQLPLLQQTTRPAIWKEWFDSLAYNAPYAMEGQRHELFSMLAVAATHHLG
ncbi:MAG: LysR family transcriptional regulator, partial [Acinetobacter sp.]|uniref:LysR family transcriptional regulator n=1 Tax=Acinetobacter sp. TaxID=472 RepID=UPI002830EA8B